MNSQDKQLFQIFHGETKDGQFKKEMIAGYALLEPGLTYYTVRLMMFPRITYYLAKQVNQLGTYMLFSKRVLVNNEVRLQNPVGSGCLTEDLKTHLEISLPMLRTKIFMSLFPKES